MGIDGSDIMAGMLTLPSAVAAPGIQGSFKTPMSPARLADLLAAERDSLVERSRAGDVRATSILDMAKGWSDADIAALADVVADLLPAPFGPAYAAEAEAEVLAHAFYVAATRSAKPAPSSRTVMALAIIPWLGARAVDALCGLAICAAERNRLDDALAFAMAALAHPDKNARACCIAGYCELKRGNRKMAQALLATATRVARHNPVFREDMRVAQRLLLTLHFD